MKAATSRNLVTFDHVFVSQYSAAATVNKSVGKIRAVLKWRGGFASLTNLRLLLVVVLAALIPVGALAAGPTLTASSPFPSEIETGVPAVFHVKYTSLSGDPATDIRMMISVSGQPDKPVLPTSPQGTDPAQGIDYTFTYTPPDVGDYKYHFVAKSAADQSTQWPSPDGEFSVYSILRNYVTLAIGVALSLLALPFLVYIIARSVNKQGNPATAARFGLIIGVLFSYAWFAWLFHSIYTPMTLALAAVGAVAMLIAIFTRR